MATITVMQLLSFLEIINHALIFYDTGTGSKPHKALLEELISATENVTCLVDLRDSSTSRLLQETYSNESFAGDQHRMVSDSIRKAILTSPWSQGIVVKLELHDCARNFVGNLDLPFGFKYGQLCIQNESHSDAFYWLLPQQKKSYRLDFEWLKDHNLSNYQVFSIDETNKRSDFTLTLPEDNCHMNCSPPEYPMVNPRSQPACNHCITCVDCRYSHFRKGIDPLKLKFCQDKKNAERTIFVVVIDFARYLLAICIALALRRVWTQGKNFCHVCLLFLSLSIRLISASLEESPSPEVAWITCLVVNLFDHLGFVAIIVDWPYRLLYFDKGTIEVSKFELIWLWLNYSIPPIMTTILAFKSDDRCTNKSINMQLMFQVFVCTAWLALVVRRRRHYMNPCTLFISVTNVYASCLAMTTLIGGLTMETRLTNLVVCSVLSAKHYLEFKRRETLQEALYFPASAGSNTGHVNNNNHNHFELWRLPSAAYMAAHLLCFSEN